MASSVHILVAIIRFPSERLSSINRIRKPLKSKSLCNKNETQKATHTAQKVKFSIMDFFSKCEQNRRKLRIWSHLLKKSLMENFIFCAVATDVFFHFGNTWYCSNKTVILSLSRFLSSRLILHTIMKTWLETVRNVLEKGIT